MASSEAEEIKKQETLVRFSIISYKIRLRVRTYETRISNASTFSLIQGLPCSLQIRIRKLNESAC